MRLPHFIALLLLALVLPSATAQLGTGNLVFGKPRLVITGDTSPGGTTRVVCYSPLDAGRTLVYAYSLGYNPTALADGRLVNLTVIDPVTGTIDPLFQASTDPAFGAYGVFGPLIPQYGVLDAYGLNTQVLNIPNIPALAGISLYCLAAIFDPTTPSITGIGRITPTATITVRNPSMAVNYVKILDPPGVAMVNTTSLNSQLNGTGNSNIRGIVRIAPVGGPTFGQGGILEHVELYEGHGFNNGPNNVNENGGGDDIDLGPVPGSWGVSVLNNPTVNYGSISSTTGVFIAGPETTKTTGNATVRFLLGTLSSTRIHRTVPPDWVTPAAPPPTGAIALFGLGGTALSWVNPVPYDRITIKRLGQIVGLLSGNATSFVDTTAWGLANYTIICELGAYTPATVSVAAVAAPYQVTLADNDSVAVNLNFLFPWYGQTYGSLHVTSNGRITFGSAGASGAADYAGTPDSFVSGPASFGCWTDLDPSLGGSITVDNQVSSIRITYSNIPHHAWPGATANFTIELTSAGTAKINGLWQSLFPVSDNLILGGGPGNDVSTSPSIDFSSVLPILSATPVNSNLAEDFPAGNLLDVTGVLLLPVIGTNSSSFRVIQV